MTSPQEQLAALVAAVDEARARCDDVAKRGPAAFVDLELRCRTASGRALDALERAVGRARECIKVASQTAAWRIEPHEHLRLFVVETSRNGPTAPREYVFPFTPRAPDPGGPEDDRGRGFVLVGSVDANDITLRCGGVSKRHFGLKRADSKVEIMDLGSAGGTFLNGSKFTRDFLRHGDQVRAGDALVTVLFGDRPEPPASVGPR